MIFTDEDLKRLKDWTEYARKKFNGARLDEFVFELKHNEVEELLARLEAAERYITSVWRNPGASEEDYWEWRKAAGK